MHGSERYGHLLINGKAPTDAQIAVLAGAATSEIAALQSELEQAGVFSRSATGAIYSRRMTDDERKARNARRNGKHGGNPKLCNTKENPASDNLEDKPPDKGSLKLRGQRPERNLSVSTREGSKHSLPEGWQPRGFTTGKCKAIVASWSPERLETEIEKFRAHHKKSGTKWADWQAAWQTWVLNSVEFERPQSRSPPNFVDQYEREMKQRVQATS
jgi:hypothetical protein